MTDRETALRAIAALNEHEDYAEGFEPLLDYAIDTARSALKMEPRERSPFEGGFYEEYVAKKLGKT
jgi:hypothetical protein